MIVQKLLEGRCVPASLLYDINCRFWAYFLAWLRAETRLAHDVVISAKQMMMPVPPFHANMHNAACRASNSLQCADFPGWINPIGEPAEQRWPLLGSGIKFKHMTKHGGTAYLECHLVFLNHRVDVRLAISLTERVASQRQLLARLRSELALFSPAAHVDAEVRLVCCMAMVCH